MQFLDLPADEQQQIRDALNTATGDPERCFLGEVQVNGSEMTIQALSVKAPREAIGQFILRKTDEGYTFRAYRAKK